MITAPFESNGSKLRTYLDEFASRAEQYRVLAASTSDKGWRDVHAASASAYEAWTAALGVIAASCERIQGNAERIGQSLRPRVPELHDTDAPSQLVE
jgi:hypothetical protein